MQVELDQTTFRRLVQLYLVTLALSVPILAFELTNPAWVAFGAEYDALVENRFGQASDLTMYVGAGLYVAVLVGHLASAMGLLKFRRWARSVFWASIFVGLLIGFVPGIYPYWVSLPSSWIALAGSSLFGMILLLAYARDQGGKWFARPGQQLQETFN